jgi:hypothetical protein
MARIDFEYLFKLRLTVARYGEMDNAQWWNTKGVLGRYGGLALGRGLPRTHYFAQARIAFAVASQRCRDIYSHPGTSTLWDLPADLEDRFQEKWHEWLDDLDQWVPFFQSIEDISGKDLLLLLTERGLLTAGQMEKAQKLRRSSEGRSVLITGCETLNDDAIAILAAGFFRGEPGKPAVPYTIFGSDPVGPVARDEDRVLLRRLKDV